MFDSSTLLQNSLLLLVGMLLVVAVFTDIRSRLIPNTVVLTVLGLGVFNLFLFPSDWPMCLMSFAIGLIVWGGLFYARLFGGGDAKLMIALSLFVLPSDLFLFYLCVLMAGGLQAAFWLITKKEKELPYAMAILLGSVLFYVLSFGIL